MILVVGLAIAGPFVSIHFIAGPPRPRLTLSESKGTLPPPVTAASMDGTWNVTTGSRAGYRVQEVLLGQAETAVGRTSDVSGAAVLAGTVLRSARFSVALATVISDQGERNVAFRGRIMDVARCPTATFVLTSPVALRRIPPPGEILATKARGDLTMHGNRRALTVKISAERAGTSIYVLADATVVFAEWHIENPSVGGFVTTANRGTLEVLLHLVKGAVRPTRASVPAATGPGGVTLPATTVPPLSINPKR